MKTTYPFAANVSAMGEKTLASGKIDYPFVLRHIQVGFAQGCNRLLRIYIYTSLDGNPQKIGVPSGTNVFAGLGNIDYIVGDNSLIDLDHDIPIKGRPTYLKVYANNLDPNDHMIDVRLTIERED